MDQEYQLELDIYLNCVSKPFSETGHSVPPIIIHWKATPIFFIVPSSSRVGQGLATLSKGGGGSVSWTRVIQTQDDARILSLYSWKITHVHYYHIHLSQYLYNRREFHAYRIAYLNQPRIQ